MAFGADTERERERKMLKKKYGNRVAGERRDQRREHFRRPLPSRIWIKVTVMKPKVSNGKHFRCDLENESNSVFKVSSSRPAITLWNSFQKSPEDHCKITAANKKKNIFSTCPSFMSENFLEKWVENLEWGSQTVRSMQYQLLSSELQYN